MARRKLSPSGFDRVNLAGVDRVPCKGLVIEVEGGLVQTVYTDADDIQIVVVDWDNNDDPSIPPNHTATYVVGKGRKKQRRAVHISHLREWEVRQRRERPGPITSYREKRRGS